MHSLLAWYIVGPILLGLVGTALVGVGVLATAIWSKVVAQRGPKRKKRPAC